MKYDTGSDLNACCEMIQLSDPCMNSHSWKMNLHCMAHNHEHEHNHADLNMMNFLQHLTLSIQNTGQKQQ